MALLGSFIDSRTLASIESNGSTSFAHGLPAAPDFVIIQGVSSASGVSSNAMALPRYAADATNVSLFGVGLAAGPTRVTAVVAHSVIR